MEVFKLTDKQRKWLESLSDEDRYPYPNTVEVVLIDGAYSTVNQRALMTLATKYRDKWKCIH